MTFEQYQKGVQDTWIQQETTTELDNLARIILALNEEAGEVAGKLKRVFRGDQRMSPVLKESLAYELGDVLYYLTMAAQVSGYTLEEIAKMNHSKLQARKQKGTIKGSGDNR